MGSIARMKSPGRNSLRWAFVGAAVAILGGAACGQSFAEANQESGADGGTTLMGPSRADDAGGGTPTVVDAGPRVPSPDGGTAVDSGTAAHPVDRAPDAGMATDAGSPLPFDAGPDCRNRFNLTVNGTEFTSHVGERFELFVRDQGGVIVGSAATLVPPSGDVTLSATCLLESGRAYTLDYYADHNGNGRCDPAPTDHSWRRSLGRVTRNVTATVRHTTSTTTICP